MYKAPSPGLSVNQLVSLCDTNGRVHGIPSRRLDLFQGGVELAGLAAQVEMTLWGRQMIHIYLQIEYRNR